MLRVGVDLMDVARVARTAERHGERFYTRFFTSEERRKCEGQPHRLAARIAAKEATAKALCTGFGAVSWTDIEVDGDARGRPILLYHGYAPSLAAHLNLTTGSLSHMRTLYPAHSF